MKLRPMTATERVVLDCEPGVPPPRLGLEGNALLDVGHDGMRLLLFAKMFEAASLFSDGWDAVTTATIWLHPATDRGRQDRVAAQVHSGIGTHELRLLGWQHSETYVKGHWHAGESQR